MPDLPASLVEVQTPISRRRRLRHLAYRCKLALGVSTSGMRRRAACGKQTSVTAGTIMHGSKLPLLAWFWAVYLMAIQSNGISALQLQKLPWLGSYLMDKCRRAMDRVAKKVEAFRARSESPPAAKALLCPCMASEMAVAALAVGARRQSRRFPSSAAQGCLNGVPAS